MSRAGPVLWSWDGSLPSLLYLTDLARREGRFPDGLEAPGDPGLFSGTHEAEVDTSRLAVEEVAGAFEGLKARHPRLCAAAYRAWMAEEGVELDLLEVAADCGSRGEVALADYGRTSLSRLAAAVRRVSREVHLLEGFARFSRRQDGLWTAVLEPDHNVLPALAPYFRGRFGLETFALCDLKRGYGLRCGIGAEGLPEVAVASGDGLGALLPDGSDREDAALWRSYFEVVENKGRHNPKVQKNLMPQRYWRHLTEFGAF